MHLTITFSKFDRLYFLLVSIYNSKYIISIITQTTYYFLNNNKMNQRIYSFEEALKKTAYTQYEYIEFQDDEEEDNLMDTSMDTSRNDAGEE